MEARATHLVIWDFLPLPRCVRATHPLAVSPFKVRLRRGGESGTENAERCGRGDRGVDWDVGEVVVVVDVGGSGRWKGMGASVGEEGVETALWGVRGRTRPKNCAPDEEAVRRFRFASYSFYPSVRPAALRRQRSLAQPLYVHPDFFGTTLARRILHYRPLVHTQLGLQI